MARDSLHKGVFRCVSCLLALLLAGVAAAAEKECAQKDTSGLTVLEYAGTTLGVKLDAGGRAMLLRRGDSGNMLYSEPALWAVEPPQPRPSSEWRAFNGHMTWIAPQQQFWARQDLLPDRRDGAADWPPDPYIIFGRFRVLEKAVDHLLIEGQDSPVSGVRLRKEFVITADGGVIHRVWARNISGREITLNLWSNTRVRGDWLGLARVTAEDMLTVQHRNWEPLEKRMLNWDVIDGWFHFVPVPFADFPAGVVSINAKVMLNPSQGLIVAVGAAAALVKRFALPGADNLYPGQGQVEIFQEVSTNPDRNVTELEFYGRYLTLAPEGETMIEERWDVLARPAGGGREEVVRWLQEALPELAPYAPTPPADNDAME